jgi:hypothetical protein
MFCSPVQVVVVDGGRQEPRGRVNGQAKLPDVTLRTEDADGRGDGRREVRDFAVGGRREVEVEDVRVGKTKDLLKRCNHVLVRRKYLNCYVF